MLTRYLRWLHLRWPAGRVERLPLANEDGSTNVPGLYIVGDITGVPLLKFSSHTGARAVQMISNDPTFQNRNQSAQRDGNRSLDLVIIGAGVSGLAAAIEAKQQGLRFEVLEANEPFSTIVNFPKGKPIFTYPTDMVPAGDLQFSEKSKIKEELIEELHELSKRHGIEPQVARVERVECRSGLLECVMADGHNLTAHRVIVGIGRSGNFRKLQVEGEDLDKVYNRLHDPNDFSGQDVLVVGGGDSALESAIALATCGCTVTLSYRKAQLSRSKPENVEKIQMLQEGSVADGAVVEEPSSKR
ncbi:MAG: NAD(P)-binding domain-containing protein, partial [Pirellulaceae bacterium]|nr:NAD(P)-binding domain-containing protein [Pirellulaceae bacterium]